MAEITRDVASTMVLSAPLERVWEAMVEQPRDPRHFPNTLAEWRQVDSDGVTVDTSIRWLPPGGYDRAVTRFVRVEAPYRYEYEVHRGAMISRGIVELRAVEGGTEVSDRVQISVDGVSRAAKAEYAMRTAIASDQDSTKTVEAREQAAWNAYFAGEEPAHPDSILPIPIVDAEPQVSHIRIRMPWRPGSVREVLMRGELPAPLDARMTLESWHGTPWSAGWIFGVRYRRPMVAEMRFGVRLLEIDEGRAVFEGLWGGAQMRFSATVGPGRWGRSTVIDLVTEARGLNGAYSRATHGLLDTWGMDVSTLAHSWRGSVRIIRG